jgi:hypothetical protein
MHFEAEVWTADKPSAYRGAAESCLFPDLPRRGAHMMRYVILPLLLALMAGCSGPARVDATSEDTLKDSLERRKADVKEGEKDSFVQDFNTVLLARGVNLFSENNGEASPASRCSVGWDVRELHQVAEKLRAEENAKLKPR